jgi:hypothetical protein
MGDVIDLNMITRLDVDPDKMLSKAIGKLEEVVILGTTKEGDEYFASSRAAADVPIYLCERAKHRLMKLIDEATA